MATSEAGPLLLCYDDSFAWSGAMAGVVDLAELDRAAAEDGCWVAADGARIAREAGLVAEPVAVKAIGPVWRTIMQTAASRHATVIVVGSRGLTGVRSMLLGSVSSAVAHHADRPRLIVHRRDDH